MLRAVRPWRNAALLFLGSVLCFAGSAHGGDEPPLSDQLSDLGRQALAQGAQSAAENFFKQALRARSRTRGSQGRPHAVEPRSRGPQSRDARAGSGRAEARAGN